MAPFPDYKMPVSIVTEQGFLAPDFDASALAWQSVKQDPQLPGMMNFSLELAWQQIFENQLGLDLANSFLIAASPDAALLRANNTKTKSDNRYMKRHLMEILGSYTFRRQSRATSDACELSRVRLPIIATIVTAS